MLKSVLAGVGVIAIAGVTAAALHAGYYSDDMQPRSLGVSTAGLDLTSQAGVALLEQRVERAVRRVCEDGDAQCHDDAWAGARPQIWAAIDHARERRASWGHRPWPSPRRYAPVPPPPEWRDDGDDERQAGYVSAPPPEPFPARGRAPVEMSGVLGGPIDGAIDHAFQTGSVTRWRDHGWRGVVRVGQARDSWPDICRMVTIVRATDGGWTPLREGEVCLGRDGRLHNGPRG